LILLSIVIAAGFLAGFVWSVRSGQYEDTCTPSLRLLMEDPVTKPGHTKFPSIDQLKK
jgi:cbb3-type cytochrome oxidase maturation protein